MFKKYKNFFLKKGVVTMFKKYKNFFLKKGVVTMFKNLLIPDELAKRITNDGILVIGEKNTMKEYKKAEELRKLANKNYLENYLDKIDEELKAETDKNKALQKEIDKLKQNTKDIKDYIVTFKDTPPTAEETALLIFLLKNNYVHIYVEAKDTCTYYNTYILNDLNEKKNEWLGI